ncbi:hypothetical protein WN943_006509 [Citrus x changshan-huyou]
MLNDVYFEGELPDFCLRARPRAPRRATAAASATASSPDDEPAEPAVPLAASSASEDRFKQLFDKLDAIASQKDRFKFVENVSNHVKIPKRARTTSLIDEGEVCGRVDEKNELLSKLFENTFEEIRVANAIIEGLDDVWDGDYNKWEPFFLSLKNGLHGSKILFAFFGRSFEDRENLEPIGRKIARKCEGLPLAAKVIGSLLRSKSTVKEWQIILDSEMWKGEGIGDWTPMSLSYNDLSSHSMVKRCFSYCFIFPKDYNMYKEELISLWMAQGYLNAKEDEEMEMIGELYFNILATRSFFQEFKKDDDEDEIISCKMHHTVHDFARRVSREECSWAEINGYLSVEINGNKESVISSVDDKVRHLGLNFEGGASFPMSVLGLNRLRTLLIYDESPSNPSLNSSILPELFSKLACLRTLVIRQSFSLFRPSPNFIREIPGNVGKLIHLKYLKLSGLRIRRLPETLCELYNLQKLDIRWCRNLRKLPGGIGKLMNMRSLLNLGTVSLKYMPVGISKLTNLRTLEKFVVAGGVGDSSRCSLKSLKNLQLLRECGIEGLSNVSHIDEAERLVLCNKNLLRFRLVFGEVVGGEGEERRRKNEKDEQLLEALQPPLNVRELDILLYGGNIFPQWLTSLTNLRNLHLRGCLNCEHLPPLGKLPLEKLELCSLKSVKRVGNEFLGIEESSEDGPSSSSSSSLVIAFPKLKSLEITDMNALEEWDYRITRKENISIMPCLSVLRVYLCPKLKVLPDYLLQTTTLQKFRILQCPSVEELPILEDHIFLPRLSSLRIEYCPKLKLLPDYLRQTTTLKELRMEGSPLLQKRYGEGKGEDWQRYLTFPTSCGRHKISLAGEQDYENEKFSQRIAKMFYWIRLAVERLPLWLLCDFEEESDGWVCSVYAVFHLSVSYKLQSFYYIDKGNRLWAEMLPRIRKEFGVDTICYADNYS